MITIFIPWVKSMEQSSEPESSEENTMKTKFGWSSCMPFSAASPSETGMKLLSRL